MWPMWRRRTRATCWHVDEKSREKLAHTDAVTSLILPYLFYLVELLACNPLQSRFLCYHRVCGPLSRLGWLHFHPRRKSVTDMVIFTRTLCFERVDRLKSLGYCESRHITGRKSVTDMVHFFGASDDRPMTTSPAHLHAPGLPATSQLL